MRNARGGGGFFQRVGLVMAALAILALTFTLGILVGRQWGGRGAPAPTVANPVREYVPSSRPGARLPHGWLVARGENVSTLDLVATDAYTLITDDAETWGAAARDLAVPVRVVAWDDEITSGRDWWSGVAGMRRGGALLVRPDQHVAARFPSCDAASAREALSRAFSHAANRMPVRRATRRTATSLSCQTKQRRGRSSASRSP